MGEDMVREVAIVEAEDLGEIRAVAASEGVDIQEVPSLELEPVTTVTLILIGGALAVAAVMSAIERRKGGQVIDLRSGAPKVLYRDKDVAFGLVIILAEDGGVAVEVKQPKEMFGQVVEALTNLLAELAKSPIEAVVDAVSAVVGDKASVTRLRRDRSGQSDAVQSE